MLHFLQLIAALTPQGKLALIDDPDTERAITNFVRLCQEAAVRGLTISLEFMVYSQLPTLARAVQLLQRAVAPVVAVGGRQRQIELAAGLYALDPDQNIPRARRRADEQQRCQAWPGYGLKKSLWHNPAILQGFAKGCVRF